jgi:hypothetical protein
MFYPKMKIHFRLAALLSVAALGAKAQEVFTVSDFEDKKAANHFSQYSEWQFISDVDSHGNSVITSGDTASSPSLVDSTSFATPGHNSNTCFKLAFKYGNIRPHGDDPDTSSYDPEVGLTTSIFNADGQDAADFTGATKVSFWAKGDKTLKFRFAAATPEVSDYAFWGDDFSVGTAWKQISLDFSAKTFAQPEWKSAAVPFNIKAIKSFMLVLSQANNPGAGGTLYIDDWTVTGWKPQAPTEDPTGLRASADGMSARMVLSRADGSARIAIPAGARNLGGTVDLYGISGKRIGSVGFGKGEREVIVPASSGAKGGLLFYRVRAASVR